MEKRGIRFGTYVLEEPIGEGGAARVFRARHATTGAPTAIKQILPEVARHELILQGLFNEAGVGRCLDHPNITRIHEFAQAEGIWYLAMELIDGPTVGQLMVRWGRVQGLPRSGLPPRVVLEIGAQICDGLAYAHAARDEARRPLKLVHRDLKPSNVMVTREGVVKVMDFGTAKATTNLELTLVGKTKGTPAYMSPEQVQGLPLDGRSDLFSVATLLAEMTTGERVFPSGNVNETMHRILHADVDAAREAVRQRLPRLDPIVQRAWQWNPDDRYLLASEMAEELRRELDAQPGSGDLGEWVWSLRDEGSDSMELITPPPLTLPEEAVEELRESQDEGA
jgi:eukaryotic-like serine/threonine-protein kinase